MNYSEWKQEYLERFLFLTKQYLCLENYSDHFSSDIANELLEYGCFNENLGFWRDISPKAVANGSFALWLKIYFRV